MERLEGLLASCDHRMLRYMSRVLKMAVLIVLITNEEVRRRCGVKNLEHRLWKTRLRWFGNVKQKDENSTLRGVMEQEAERRRPVVRPKKTCSNVVGG